MQSKLIISIDKIQKNWESINQLSNLKASAVVKANAYGFGTIEIVKALVKKGCDFFYVAHFEEAIELRKKLQLNNFKIAAFEGMIHEANDYKAYRIIPILNNLVQLNKLNQYNNQNPTKPLKGILNFDTGMNRLGFEEKEILKINSNYKIVNSQNIIFLMSHLSNANVNTSIENNIQLNKVKNFSKNLKGIKLSLSNTNGILLGKNFVLDQTRPGIGIYGLDANGNQIYVNKAQLQIPFNLRCPIIQIRKVKKGKKISYEGITKLNRNTIIATIGIGYADGIFRSIRQNLKIKIKNINCEILGNITMDSFMIDITDIKENYLKVGDYIDIVNSENFLSNFIKNSGFNIYEIFTHFSDRIVKIYE